MVNHGDGTVLPPLAQVLDRNVVW